MIKQVQQASQVPSDDQILIMQLKQSLQASKSLEAVVHMDACTELLHVKDWHLPRGRLQDGVYFVDKQQSQKTTL